MMSHGWFLRKKNMFFFYKKLTERWCMYNTALEDKSKRTTADVSHQMETKQKHNLWGTYKLQGCMVPNVEKNQYVKMEASQKVLWLKSRFFSHCYGNELNFLRGGPILLSLYLCSIKSI